MYCRGIGVFYWSCKLEKKKKKIDRDTINQMYTVEALVCTVGAFVLFIGTVATVQTLKNKKTQ